MPTLIETLNLVTAEDTTIDSVIVLVNSLKQQVADLLSGANVPPAVQAQVDAIFDAVTKSKTKLDAALAANVTP